MHLRTALGAHYHLPASQVAFVGKAELQKVGEREGDRERKDVQSPLYLLHHHIKHSLGVYATIIKFEYDIIIQAPLFTLQQSR